MPTDFLRVLRAFQDAQVRYVLVGGLAVLLHGVDRLTAVIDLIVDLAPEQVSRAIETLLAMGFRTQVPVDARLFADPATRKLWREESSMVVLSFWDPQNRCPTVDVFAEYPMDCEKLFGAAVLMPLSGTDVRVDSIQRLIDLKRAAGRPRDLEDAAHLAQVREGNGP
jgi:hypothetical protein